LSYNKLFETLVITSFAAFSVNVPIKICSAISFFKKNNAYLTFKFLYLANTTLKNFLGDIKNNYKLSKTFIHELKFG